MVHKSLKVFGAIAVCVAVPLYFSPMITYNPKTWFAFLFRFQKSDTLRQLTPVIIGICIYSAAVAYLELTYWKLSDNHHLRNIPILHTALSFVISMLLVFRTNTAYERWWEGRKLWGALVNTSRNLAVKLAVILPEGAIERDFFRNIIPQYAVALRTHLLLESTRLELDAKDHPEFSQIAYEKHVPNQIQLLIFKKINDLYKTQT